MTLQYGGMTIDLDGNLWLDNRFFGSAYIILHGDRIFEELREEDQELIREWGKARIILRGMIPVWKRIRTMLMFSAHGGDEGERGRLALFVWFWKSLRKAGLAKRWGHGFSEPWIVERTQALADYLARQGLKTAIYRPEEHLIEVGVDAESAGEIARAARAFSEFLEENPQMWLYWSKD